MQVDSTQIATHVEGLTKGPIIYVAAFLLTACVTLFLALVAALNARVRQEQAHKRELMTLLAGSAKSQLQLEHSLRAFLGCVKAGVWRLREFRAGEKIRPQPLPEDPEQDNAADLMRAFDEPTAATKLPGGGGSNG